MAPSSSTPDNTNPEDTPDILNPTVANLKDSSIFPSLWYRIHVLLADLKSFDKPASNKRLEKIVDPSFIGEPYFTPKEAETIKKTIIDGKEFTQLVEEGLNKRLDRRNKKRFESGDFRICAAHDLAPIMAQALGIDLKRLEKDKSFTNLVEEKGLHLEGEGWCGLEKKSFAPKRKKR
ncbi:hypothetical protein P875_00108693 [Aspergillus parasiticus SU-1]|uniref:Uncharacterized protein n=2 Tax=Aspergillus parasiticus TaxID=5067 RepID=A0A5N6DCX5_ASPPA|nr:hypothetical protein BDV34DRAFT_227899 [Aspergillus parasiticus]KJK68045.1 hypothetical protein P875_00108693 [Aspergillus parasiticus SU-1]